MDGVVSLSNLIARLAGPWQPVDVVGANDAVVRLARFEGEFPWHHHDEDELFLCWDGSFRVEMRDREPATLGAGELCVVPRGVERRPVAEQRAHGLMLERPETKQYGNEGTRSCEPPRGPGVRLPGPRGVRATSSTRM